MNSKDQFVALEVMCREREALAKKEMEYWLAEAEEWKQLRESPDPFAERRITPTVGCPGSSIGSTQRHHRKERDYTWPNWLQSLFYAASWGPIQQVHREKLECGNDERSN